MGFFLKGVCFQKATSQSYFISLFAMFESRLLSVFSEYQKKMVEVNRIMKTSLPLWKKLQHEGSQFSYATERRVISKSDIGYIHTCRKIATTKLVQKNLKNETNLKAWTNRLAKNARRYKINLSVDKLPESRKGTFRNKLLLTRC